MAQQAQEIVVSITELRDDLRKYLEQAHFRGRHILVERNRDPFVVVIGVEEYRRLVQADGSRAIVR